MRGSSCRLWSAAAYRSFLQNPANNFRKAFRSCPASLDEGPQVVSSTPNYKFFSNTSWQGALGSGECPRQIISYPLYYLRNPTNNVRTAFLSCPASLGECRQVVSSTPIYKFFGNISWQVAPASGECARQIISSHCLLSKSGHELSSLGSSWPMSSSTTNITFCQDRQFASSASYVAKLTGKANKGVAYSQLKRRKGGVGPRKAKPFAGALSSIKHLQSERGRRKPGSISVHGDSRKQNGRPLRESGRKTAHLSTRLPFRARPVDEGLTLKRKRKRIRPHPQDITYKRGLDLAVVNVAVNSRQQDPVQEKASSLNARFRQFQPSRELLAHIEENLLGRRRIAEWRKGGYDPKRKAPLDDLPGSKEKCNSIQETFLKQKLTFIAAAKQARSLPPLQHPEVAFAGRSNVGKSSLVNALTRRWGVARTSDKPGLTQSINFFALGSQLCLVDLPGYGFAYAKEEKKEEWEELVKDYVQTRSNLRRVCLLVDAKWGLKSRDEELLHLMESAGTQYQIVLTKTDVLSPMDLARRATQILQVLEDHRCLIRPMAASVRALGPQTPQPEWTELEQGMGLAPTQVDG